MPNIASVLKAEVARLVRKELRSETEDLKKALAKQRSEVTLLKQRILALERAMKLAARGAKAGRSQSPASLSSEASSDGTSLRFRAAGMASNRKRLGLSAEDFGALIGTTGQSVYAWEQGKSRPREKFLASIAALRGIGKREALARLAAAGEGS